VPDAQWFERLIPSRPVSRMGRCIAAMPQDSSRAHDIADRVRDDYLDRHGTTSQTHRSAAWDAAYVNVALQQLRVAKAALQDLTRCGDLPVTRAPGAGSDALRALDDADEEMERVLDALRTLQRGEAHGK